MDAARARLYRCEAVVLKRHDLGEADRILTLLTAQAGKVRAVAKGVRRPGSRMAGHLEPFVHSQLLLARGRELDIVTQAETIHAFRALRADLWRVAHAGYVAELLDGVTAERAEHRELFDLLLDTLAALDGSRVPAVVVGHFQLHLLDAVGYRPELSRCLGCRALIEPGPNSFSVPLGGVFCPRCGSDEPSARPISVRALKLLRFLQRTPTAAAAQIGVDPPTLAEVERLLVAYLEHQVERKLRAPGVIARLRAALPSRMLTSAAAAGRPALSEEEVVSGE